MLLKLYKREQDKSLYWEAWDEEEEITIHFGEVGTTGDTVTVPLNEFEPPETAIDREAADARQNGFSEIDQVNLFEVILQYQIEGMGTPRDVETAFQLEELLNECLGWTGNGHCDGNDLGGGTMNIYSYVIEPRLASATIVEELTRHELLDGAVIAYQDHDENFVVVWPEGYKEVFNY